MDTIEKFRMIQAIHWKEGSFARIFAWENFRILWLTRKDLD